MVPTSLRKPGQWCTSLGCRCLSRKTNVVSISTNTATRHREKQIPFLRSRLGHSRKKRFRACSCTNSLTFSRRARGLVARPSERTANPKVHETLGRDYGLVEVSIAQRGVELLDSSESGSRKATCVPRLSLKESLVVLLRGFPAKQQFSKNMWTGSHAAQTAWEVERVHHPSHAGLSLRATRSLRLNRSLLSLGTSSLPEFSDRGYATMSGEASSV